MNLAFAPWGQRWKRMRKVANLGLSAKASAEYAALQENEARYFLRGLLTCEGKVDAHIRRTSASMILSAIYAYPPLPPPSSHSHLGNPHSLVAQIEDYVARMLKAALPGNYLVDFFPSLLKVPMWFPGASWKREGYAWFRKDTEMFQGLIQETVAALVCFMISSQQFSHCPMICRTTGRVEHALSRSFCRTLHSTTWTPWRPPGLRE